MVPSRYVLLFTFMHFSLRDLSLWFNYAEVALWPAVGLVLLILGLRRSGAVRRDCIIAAGVLVLFGASDWFEAREDNEWWRPWWLFLWKAVCVAALAWLLFVAWRRERESRRRLKPLLR